MGTGWTSESTLGSQPGSLPLTCSALAHFLTLGNTWGLCSHRQQTSSPQALLVFCDGGQQLLWSKLWQSLPLAGLEDHKLQQILCWRCGDSSFLRSLPIAGKSRSRLWLNQILAVYGAALPSRQPGTASWPGRKATRYCHRQTQSSKKLRCWKIPKGSSLSSACPTFLSWPSGLNQSLKCMLVPRPDCFGEIGCYSCWAQWGQWSRFELDEASRADPEHGCRLLFCCCNLDDDWGTHNQAACMARGCLQSWQCHRHSLGCWKAATYEAKGEIYCHNLSLYSTAAGFSPTQVMLALRLLIRFISCASMFRLIRKQNRWSSFLQRLWKESREDPIWVWT